MSKLVLNTYPEDKDILLTKAVTIKLEYLDEFKEFIEAMKDLVKEDDNAVGLSSNQVWVHSENYPPPKIFVMGMADGSVKEFINPEVRFTGKTLKHIEGCLSRPNKLFRIKRSKNCIIHYFDMDGEEHTEKYGGAYAQIIGHEMQHLSGGILKREVKDRGH